jgi:hypothetical protein
MKKVLLFLSISIIASAEGTFYFTRDVGLKVGEKEVCRGIEQIVQAVANCRKIREVKICGRKGEKYFLFEFNNKQDCEVALISSKLSGNPAKLDKRFLGD